MEARADSQLPEAPRQDSLFDDGWKFIRADLPGAEKPDFEDAGWSTISLPHDWSIEDLPRASLTASPWVAPAAIWNDPATDKADIFAMATVPPSAPGGPPLAVGPFDAVASAGAGNTGWLVGGTAWYRKTFETPTLAQDERITLRFDGSAQTSEVWINGVSLGTNSYGYSAFTFDITEHLIRGAHNVIAVRVRNEGETSRWYSGSGLHRHCWLTVTGPVAVSPWGVYVQTTRVESHEATLLVSINIDSRLQTQRLIDVTISVREPSGDLVATRKVQMSVASNHKADKELELRLPHPKLWGPQSPLLYTAEVLLEAGGKALDFVNVRFGVRTIAVSAERGLTINGVPVKLKGACIHADNGILGAAAIDRAEYRKIEVLKSFGYNAIRMGHQMASPALLDACDQAGVLVIDEVFDVWERAKLKNDFSRLFRQNWESVVTSMVRQHRNHPSIVFWSIGNEIPEAAEARGVQIAAQLRGAVLALDASRPITAALVLTYGEKGEPARRSLDVAGYNYGQQHYEEDHKLFPSLVIMGTEQFSRDMHDGWRKVESSSWVLGEFIWSGFDYLGEVGSGSSELRKIDGEKPKAEYVIYLWDYPAYVSGCGEIDILGARKPQGKYRDVLWNRSAIELLVQRPTPLGMYERISDWGWHDELESWTWPASSIQTMTVRAYTSGDTVKLILNDKEIAQKRLAPQDKLKAEFEVTYKPGTLLAIAYRAGFEIGRKKLSTVGEPARLLLRSERASISRSRNDLAYVFVEVCDAQGRKLPDASVPVTFAATGAAEIRATGSANPRGIKSFSSPDCTTFHGEALAIIQPQGKAGKCVVTAAAPGIAMAQAVITLSEADMISWGTA